MKPANPLITLALTFATGVAAFKYISAAPYIPGALSILFIILFFILSNKKRYIFPLLMAGFFFFGGALIEYKSEKAISSTPDISRYERVEAEGKVLDRLDSSSGKEKLIVSVSKLRGGKADGFKCCLYLNLSSEEKASQAYIPEPGDLIRFNGSIIPTSKKLNPGQFDFGEYLRMQEIFAAFYSNGLGSITVIGRDNHAGILSKAVFSVRESIENTIKKSIKEPEAGLLLGIVLGKSNAAEEEIQEYFTNTGTIHILVASGMNVSIIAGFILWILMIAAKRNILTINEKIRFLIPIPFIVFYALIAGGSAPIIRATIMGIIFLAALSLSKDYDPVNSLIFTGFIMLLINPYNLFQASFQLSFLAVLGLLMFYSPIRNFLPSKKKVKDFLNVKPGKTARLFKTDKLPEYTAGLYDFFAGLLAVTISAQIFLIPLIAYYFNRVSIISIIANMLIVPPAGIALPAGLLAGIIGIIIPAAAKIMLTAISPLITFMIWSAKTLGSLPYASAYVPTFEIQFIFIYIAFFLLLGINNETINKNRKIFIASTLIAAVFFIILQVNLIQTNHRAIFFSLHKRCTLLIEKHNSSTLIIAYPEREDIEDKNEIEYSLKPYLLKSGINRIENFVIIGKPGDILSQDLPLILGACKIKNMFITDEETSMKLKNDALFSPIISSGGIKIYDENLKYDISDKISKFSINPKNSKILAQYLWKDGDIFIINPDYKTSLDISPIKNQKQFAVFLLPRFKRAKKSSYQYLQGIADNNSFFVISPAKINVGGAISTEKDGAVIIDLNENKVINRKE